MAASGHCARVVKISSNHTYEIDENELKSILLNDEIKDLPVVVVSVSGKYRSGKSFLINYFLKYLTSSQSAQADGSWLNDDIKPVVGFHWSRGSRADTKGILLWSQPIIISLPSGEKAAVLFMDTQGTFSSENTAKDNNTIFGLSTLLSSVQIYNVSNELQENDLQKIDLVLKDMDTRGLTFNGTKSLQKLEIVVRDWQFLDECDFGVEGGKQLLNEKFTISANMTEDAKKLRRHIISSFDNISCFLMPHPGFQVTRTAHFGDNIIDDIEPDFKTYIKELVTSLLDPKNLMPKRINGEVILAKDLVTYFKIYTDAYNKEEGSWTDCLKTARDKIKNIIHV